MITVIKALVCLVACCAGLGASAPGLAQTCPPPASVLTPQDAKALARDARDRGFLWRIEKQERVGYLYGSIHVGKRAWAIPGPKTLAALAASDVVALEIDVLDPGAFSEMAEPSRFGIKPVALPPALQTRLNAFARKVCAQPESLAKLHPSLQLVTVTLLEARLFEFDVSYGSEVFLASYARESGKPVVSLESVELQMRTLLAGDDAEIIDSVNRALPLLEQGRLRAVTERMAAAWAHGNLRELENYAQWCECAETEADRKSFEQLNDERNPGLASGIDKLMREGKSVFAAVGALHMIGAKALPKLLRDMGYQIERVNFDR